MGERSPQVFISHTHQPAEFVDRLAGDLAGRGLNVWLDRWALQPGEPWQKALETALDRSRVYLLIIDPSSSVFQRAEWSAALERSWSSPGKTVIPILLQGAPLPAGLRGWPAIRVTEYVNEPLKPVIDEIEKAVRASLLGDVKRTAPAGSERDLQDRLVLVEEVADRLERDMDRGRQESNSPDAQDS